MEVREYFNDVIINNKLQKGRDIYRYFISIIEIKISL